MSNDQAIQDNLIKAASRIGDITHVVAESYEDGSRISQDEKIALLSYCMTANEAIRIALILLATMAGEA